MIHLDPTSDTFHIDLKRIRAQLGLTQTALAEKLGISSVMTQRYEAERNKKNSARPNPATMQKMEKFFAKEMTKTGDIAASEVESAEPAEMLKSLTTELLLDEIERRGYEISIKKLPKRAN